jgi:hypothetical protein
VEHPAKFRQLEIHCICHGKAKDFRGFVAGKRLAVYAISFYKIGPVQSALPQTI